MTYLTKKMNGRGACKCMEENSLMLQWQRTNFRDASTCADPGFAGTRAPLSITSLKYLG